MLGEGARTAADAERYFASYAHAIEAIGASAGKVAPPNRPGISVKLSALHPRFEPVSRDRVLPSWCRKADRARPQGAPARSQFHRRRRGGRPARAHPRRDRGGARRPSLRGWEGFGLAVQAYQKRAPAVIDWLAETARALRRRLMVRLVKGAYWDTEVKRAQERGLADYPVFTRKAMTDLCYAACARKLLARGRGSIRNSPPTTRSPWRA